MAQYRFQAIHTQTWHDEKFVQLTNNAKLLFLYLLTCPQSTMAGIYVLEPGNTIEDLGYPYETVPKWFIDGIANRFETLPDTVSDTVSGTSTLWYGLAQLIRIGLIDYDHVAKVLLIKNYLRHNPIISDTVLIKVVRLLQKLPKTALIESLLEVTDSMSEGKTNGMRDGYTNGFLDRLPIRTPIAQGMPGGIAYRIADGIPEGIVSKNKDKDKNKNKVPYDIPTPPTETKELTALELALQDPPDWDPSVAYEC